MATTLFNKALAFLARREYSEKELYQKLCLKFPEEKTEIAKTIAILKEKQYLNNERFIEGLIRHRLNQGYGVNRIFAELTQVHGLRAEEINPYLHNNEQEGNQIKALIIKKFKSLDFPDLAMRNKAIAYCLRRGFPLQEIKAALREVA